ncbi:MAG: outer membrane protein, partial [Tsuneonella sp.]
DEVRLSAGRDLYVGGRLGFQAGASTLFYVKGGYTDARLKGSYDDGVTVVSESDSLGGFRVGGGLEQKFGSNFAVRAEYRYSDYGEYSYDGFNTGISVSRHQGMLGLIGKF